MLVAESSFLFLPLSDPVSLGWALSSKPSCNHFEMGLFNSPSTSIFDLPHRSRAFQVLNVAPIPFVLANPNPMLTRLAAGRIAHRGLSKLSHRSHCSTDQERLRDLTQVGSMARIGTQVEQIGAELPRPL